MTVAPDSPNTHPTEIGPQLPIQYTGTTTIEEFLSQANNNALRDTTENATGNATGNVTGNATGNATGNVTGNATGNATGNVTGNVTGEAFGDVISPDLDSLYNTYDYNQYQKMQQQYQQYQQMNQQYQQQHNDQMDHTDMLENGFGSHSHVNGVERETPFIGLSNQGATCYLNSLIQSLYMTPEIRNALYTWRYNKEIHGSASRSIPYQLQRLFVLLEKCKRSAVSTEDLTKSFGWTTRDAFVQHDINELCRVLFDALDKTFAPNLYRMRNELSKTDNKDEIARIEAEYKDLIDGEHLMSDMYAGTMIDYIHATGRTTEDGKPIGRERKDKFLDLQLVAHGTHSLLESLENYIKPEEMTGENKWRCDELDEFVDATKGFFFQDFPQLLTLHLKRFDYDRRTWTPIKLSHRIEFPFELDIRPFVPKDYDKETRYELFSCLIHSGTVTSGHYFAYIKNLTDGKWYEFNDSHVKEITIEDVQRMYGRDEDIHAYSSTNAYMLMYRRIDLNTNNKIHTEYIPNDLIHWVNEINIKVEKERREEEIRKTSCRLDIHLQSNNNPPQLRGINSIQVEIPNFASIRDLKIATIKKYKERQNSMQLSNETEDDEESINIWELPLDCYRFRVCSYQSIGKVITDENTPIKHHVSNYGDLLLQVKQGEDWPVDNRKIAVNLYFYDMMEQVFENPVTLEFLCRSTIREIRENLSMNIEYKGQKFTPDRIGLIKKTNNPFDIINLVDPSRLDLQIEEAGISHRDNVYVEILDYEGAHSIVCRKLELDEFYYILYFNYPGTNEYTNRYEGLKSETQADMKRNISNLINVPENEFIISIVEKNGSLMAITDQSKRLQVAPGIFNNTRLHIELGRPLAPGEFQVDIIKYIPEDEYFKAKDLEMKKKRAIQKKAELEAKRAQKKQEQQLQANNANIPSTSSAPTPTLEENQTKDSEDTTPNGITQTTNIQTNIDDFLINPKIEAKEKIVENEELSYYLSHDHRRHLFQYLGKVIVSNATTVAQLKKNIAEEFLSGIDEDRLRVRICDGVDVYGLLSPNEARLLYSVPKLGAHTKFGVQVLKDKEDIPEKPMIISIRRWCSSSWTFGSASEFIFDTQSIKTTAELKKLLANTVGIEVENLGVHKAPSTLDTWKKKECADIALLSWTYESNNIYEDPVSLRDGDTILYRDLRESERISVDDLLLRNGPSSFSHAFKARFLNQSNVKRAPKTRDYETALKISTEFDESPQKSQAKEKMKRNTSEINTEELYPSPQSSPKNSPSNSLQLSPRSSKDDSFASSPDADSIDTASSNDKMDVDDCI